MAKKCERGKSVNKVDALQKLAKVWFLASVGEDGVLKKAGLWLKSK